MRTRNYEYYMADFETTVYEGQTYTEVWAAAVVKLWDDEVEILHSFPEFLDYMCDKKTNIICYFHNIKFDGNFILDYLLRNGYKWNRVAEGKMLNKQFKCAISDRGPWYSITVKMHNMIIEFRDSYKLLPFSVKRIGKGFQTKHRKLDMEYEGFRYAGCVITDEEKSTYVMMC